MCLCFLCFNVCVLTFHCVSVCVSVCDVSKHPLPVVVETEKKKKNYGTPPPPPLRA